MPGRGQIQVHHPEGLMRQYVISSVYYHRFRGSLIWPGILSSHTSEDHGKVPSRPFPWTGTETDPQRIGGGWGGGGGAWGLDSVPGTRKNAIQAFLVTRQPATQPPEAVNTKCTLSLKCPCVRFSLCDRILDIKNSKGRLILIPRFIGCSPRSAGYTELSSRSDKHRGGGRVWQRLLTS